MEKMKLTNLLSPTLLMGAVALFSVAPVSAQGLPDGQGRETYENVCGSCHGADIVVGSQGARARWEETVESMRARGAYGSDDDFKVVVNYLTRYFGMPVNVNKATAKDLQSEFGVTADVADAIVKYRVDHDGIKDYADFENVPGLPKAEFAMMKSRVVFK